MAGIDGLQRQPGKVHLPMLLCQSRRLGEAPVSKAFPFYAREYRSRTFMIYRWQEGIHMGWLILA